MKKMLFMGIVASAALAMTGCSSDETALAPSQSGNAIEFGTYLGRDAQVRGTEMTTDALQNMGVYAAYTEQKDFADASTPNFMFNQKVEKKNGNWEYSPLKYWPTTIGDKVSFFAYAPYTEESKGVVSTNSTNTTTDAPTLTVKLPTTDLTNMVDFVAGVKMNQTHTTTGDNNTAVKFNLKHELTRVGIQAKVSQNVYGTDAKNKTKVVITDIQLDPITDGQFYASGVYTFPTNESDNGTWEGTAATTALDLKTLQTKTQYTVGTGYNKEGIILEGTKEVSLFTNNQYLFLIPANGATGLTEGKATVTITYDIVTEDTALDKGCSVTHAVKTVNIPASTLKQGTAYTLTFTINVDEVKLSAEVANWATETDDVTVDYKDKK